MGEDISEYSSIWGYSIGETESRIPIYEYPCYEFEVTSDFTNLQSDQYQNNYRANFGVSSFG